MAAKMTVFLHETHNEYQYRTVPFGPAHTVILSYEQCWQILLQGLPVQRLGRILKTWEFTGEDADMLQASQANFKEIHAEEISAILAENGIPETALVGKDVVYRAAVGNRIVTQDTTSNVNS